MSLWRDGKSVLTLVQRHVEGVPDRWYFFIDHFNWLFAISTATSAPYFAGLGTVSSTEFNSIFDAVTPWIDDSPVMPHHGEGGNRQLELFTLAPCFLSVPCATWHQTGEQSAFHTHALLTVTHRTTYKHTNKHTYMRCPRDSISGAATDARWL